MVVINFCSPPAHWNVMTGGGKKNILKMLFITVRGASSVKKSALRSTSAFPPACTTFIFLTWKRESWWSSARQPWCVQYMHFDHCWCGFRWFQLTPSLSVKMHHHICHQGTTSHRCTYSPTCPQLISVAHFLPWNIITHDSFPRHQELRHWCWLYIYKRW